MRAAVYVRLSRDSEETTSPTRQRASCSRLIDDRGWTFDPERDVFEDLDVSAYSGRRRPAFERLLASLDRYDVIVFWRLDRVARSTVEFGKILEACDKTSTALVSATEPFDTSTPIGEAMAWIVMVFAQLESRTIGLRVRSSQEHLVESRRWRGGRRPFGWQVVPVADGAGRRLVLDPEEAPLLRRAVEEVIAGRTVPELVREWNVAGVRTSLGGEWSHRTLYGLLRSPVLLGQVVRHGRPLAGPDGALAVVNEPLVDEFTYLRLQAVMDSRKVVGRRRRDETFLGGIPTCGECGAPMWADTTSYLCRQNYRNRDACPGNGISRAFLESVVEEWLAARLRQPGFIERATAVLHEASKRPSAQATQAADVRTALDRLEEDRLDGLYDDSDGRRRYVERHRRLTAELERLTTVTVQEAPADVVALVEGVELTAEGIRAMPVARRKSLARAVIGELVVRKAAKIGGPKRDLGRITLSPR